jgi:hypothetical protein
MLQRSSLPTTSSAELADSLQRSLDRPFAGRRWQSLQDVFPMPETWQQYVLACLAIGMVVGGMGLQVLLSAQIARAELTLQQMRSEYARVERQNSQLVYAIAQQSSLAQMAELATQNGYVPATGRTYIVRSKLAATPAPIPGGVAAESAVRNPLPTMDRVRPDSAGPTPGWLDRTRQWWHDLQQSMSTATSQLWRDVTGRME